jgi:cyclophilin family peptidyl-prolyl cis-trans isomerase
MKQFALIAFAVLLAGALVYAFMHSDGPTKPNDGGGPSGSNSQVVMETSIGTIKIELFGEKAPISVENFLKYVDAKHYDGTIFHRVIPDFMIQGGGFEPGLREKRSKFGPIRNEAGNGLSNVRGSLAMARTDDPHSATDQFFINVENNIRGLDRKASSAGYAVFGKVIDGMDVVDKIKMVRTGTMMGQKDVPVQDVMIKSIRRVEAK